MVFADKDWFSRQVANINTADCNQLEQPAFFAFHNHKTNFIHVGCQHYTQRAGLLCLSGGQDIPQGIHFYRITVRLDLFKHNLANFANITEDTAGI